MYFRKTVYIVNTGNIGVLFFGCDGCDGVGAMCHPVDGCLAIDAGETLRAVIGPSLTSIQSMRMSLVLWLFVGVLSPPFFPACIASYRCGP